MDTTHTGCRALIRLYGRWVVVGFNFKCATQSITDVNQACIFFSCSHQQAGAFSRQGFEVFDRIFVATMLAPHDRKNAQLCKIWGPPQNFFDLLKFFRQKTQLASCFNRG